MTSLVELPILSPTINCNTSLHSTKQILNHVSAATKNFASGERKLAEERWHLKFAKYEEVNSLHSTSNKQCFNDSPSLQQHTTPHYFQRSRRKISMHSDVCDSNLFAMLQYLFPASIAQHLEEAVILQHSWTFPQNTSSWVRHIRSGGRTLYFVIPVENCMLAMAK